MVKFTNNGYDTCSRDFEEQIPGVTQKIWAASWKRCLEQAGIHEDSPLCGRTLPENLDILMIPTEVDIGNGGTTSSALTTRDTDLGQTETRVSTHIESVEPIIPTSMPTPNVVDMTVEDTSEDTSAL